MQKYIAKNIYATDKIYIYIEKIYKLIKTENGDNMACVYDFI